jgi:hypothetical protein
MGRPGPLPRCSGVEAAVGGAGSTGGWVWGVGVAGGCGALSCVGSGLCAQADFGASAAFLVRMGFWGGAGADGLDAGGAGIWLFVGPPTELRTWEFRPRGMDPCRPREGCGEEGWLGSRGRRRGEGRWRQQPRECRGALWSRGSRGHSGSYKRD